MAKAIASLSVHCPSPLETLPAVLSRHHVGSLGPPCTLSVTRDSHSYKPQQHSEIPTTAESQALQFSLRTSAQHPSILLLISISQPWVHSYPLQCPTWLSRACVLSSLTRPGLPRGRGKDLRGGARALAPPSTSCG